MTVIQMNIFITYFYYLFEFNTSKLLTWGQVLPPFLSSNKKSFEKVKLLTPYKSEQIKIASALAKSDKQSEILQSNLNHLKNEKKP